MGAAEPVPVSEANSSNQVVHEEMVAKTSGHSR